MNRLTKSFSTSKPVLNIYYTAGYPQLDNTVSIAKQLYKNGVDIIEIGIPFSDPLADGKTIQMSSQVALDNGMTIPLLFKQITEIRKEVQTLPIVLMGYLNQLLQVGVESFLSQCQQTGVDALIIPDLPLDVYQEQYQELFEQYHIKICFLITPQTSTERIKTISKACTGFLYVVSSYSTTGNKLDINTKNHEYFSTINTLNLKIPKLIGFGIHDRKSFHTASKYANGAIIGSAFINALQQPKPIEDSINTFIQTLQ